MMNQIHKQLNLLLEELKVVYNGRNFLPFFSEQSIKKELYANSVLNGFEY